MEGESKVAESPKDWVKVAVPGSEPDPLHKPLRVRVLLLCTGKGTFKSDLEGTTLRATRCSISWGGSTAIIRWRGCLQLCVGDDGALACTSHPTLHKRPTALAAYSCAFLHQSAPWRAPLQRNHTPNEVYHPVQFWDLNPKKLMSQQDTNPHPSLPAHPIPSIFLILV